MCLALRAYHVVTTAILLDISRAFRTRLDPILELPAFKELRMRAQAILVLCAREADMLLDVAVSAYEDQTRGATDDSARACGSVYD